MNTDKGRISGAAKTAGMREKVRQLQNTEEGLTPAVLLINCAVSALIGLASSLVLLAVFAFVSYSNADPDKLAMPLALAALYAGTLVCGVLTSKRNGSRILLGGIVSALLYFFLIFALSLFSSNEGLLSGLSGSPLLIAHLCVAGGVLAGALLGGVKRRETIPKHKLPQNHKK